MSSSILKHLDGDLLITRRPPTAGERRAETKTRGKANGLREIRRLFVSRWFRALDLNPRRESLRVTPTTDSWITASQVTTSEIQCRIQRGPRDRGIRRRYRREYAVGV